MHTEERRRWVPVSQSRVLHFGEVLLQLFVWNSRNNGRRGGSVLGLSLRLVLGRNGKGRRYGSGRWLGRNDGRRSTWNGGLVGDGLRGLGHNGRRHRQDRDRRLLFLAGCGIIRRGGRRHCGSRALRCGGLRNGTRRHRSRRDPCCHRLGRRPRSTVVKPD